MAADRVGDECWYNHSAAYQNRSGPDIWERGVLRVWFKGPPFVAPLAVIEDRKTGMCQEVRISGICFAQRKPGSTEESVPFEGPSPENQSESENKP